MTSFTCVLILVSVILAFPSLHLENVCTPVIKDVTTPSPLLPSPAVFHRCFLVLHVLHFHPYILTDIHFLLLLHTTIPLLSPACCTLFHLAFARSCFYDFWNQYPCISLIMFYTFSIGTYSYSVRFFGTWRGSSSNKDFFISFCICRRSV